MTRKELEKLIQEQKDLDMDIAIYATIALELVNLRQTLERIEKHGIQTRTSPVL
mgnify:CR=1 FL=1